MSNPHRLDYDHPPQYHRLSENERRFWEAVARQEKSKTVKIVVRRKTVRPSRT